MSHERVGYFKVKKTKAKRKGGTKSMTRNQMRRKKN